MFLKITPGAAMGTQISDKANPARLPPISSSAITEKGRNGNYVAGFFLRARNLQGARL